MIFYVFLCQVLSLNITNIEKTIYLIEGEEYKVNLDSIFKEEKENNYSFKSNNKGFTLDTSSLKLKSDQGVYSIIPTKIIRERQLINLEDYQGLGQFGILDQHDLGHRICYNNDAIFNLDQCIELDNTANNYDFVFIDRNTIAVSMVRVTDQQFGVKIYQNKKLMHEFYFYPSKTYAQVKQTIIEYCVFEQKKYLLFGFTEEDSNIEFLEIQDNFQMVNANQAIDKSLLPQKQVLQVYDIKGGSNKVYVVYNSIQQDKLIISFSFQSKWIQQRSQIVKDFRSFQLGYSFTKKYLDESYLLCYKGQYNITSNQETLIFRNFSILINPNAKIKYTLNYLIVLQDNLIFVSNLYKVAQRRNKIEGSLLQIDVDFQNDILILFTDSKIITFYLKQSTLSYSSDIITENLDQVTIQAISEESEQIANIYFQVLSKDDYNLYELQDLTHDLYYNPGFQSTKTIIPLTGMSGPAIQVDLKVNDSIQIITNYLDEHQIGLKEQTKQHVIQEYLITTSSKEIQNKKSTQYNVQIVGQFILLTQLDDFSFQNYECSYCNINQNINLQPCISYRHQNQRVIYQLGQSEEYAKNALLDSDGRQIHIEFGCDFGLFFNQFVKTSDDKFVDMKVGTDRLFIYTEKYFIQVYYFTKEQVKNILNLSQFGQPQGEIIRKLWVNQAQTNLIVITFGEDLIIGRFTTQFIFMQRITIKFVIDVAIIADNKFIVLSTDKTNKKLTQYIIEEGRVRIQRELGTYGYIITGGNIICDHVRGQIIIQAQKDQQKALLIFGDTELARDSLLKVIKLQDDEFVVNIMYLKQQSCLFKRTTDDKKNSSLIIGINNAYKEFELNLRQIPNEFSQQSQLEYIFSNQFSKNIFKKQKNLYIEYSFQNITVKQPYQTITYKNEDFLKIQIKPDTFQGQVRTLKLEVKKDPQVIDHFNFNFTTRFKSEKCFIRIFGLIKCNYVSQFERILCVERQQVTYYSINSEIISQVRANISSEKQQSYLIEMILNNNECFALIRKQENELILINITQNDIQLSHKQYWKYSFNISIFYKNWLVLCNNTEIIYFKFQPQANDLFLTQQYKEIVINKIQAIQYDQITQQIFYSTGDQNLYYFKSSLEGDQIDKQPEYSFNILQLLISQKIYQRDLIIQFIKIVTLQQNSYILVSTSYGNIWNITIEPLLQKINNMYIVDGPYQQVYDVQLIDDYMLVYHYKSKQINDQIGFDYYYEKFQSLYKNTHDWKLNKPYLPLEAIFASQIIGLFKNCSQIVLIYQNGEFLNQRNIDDEVSITIIDLKSFPFGVLKVIASNGYGKADVNYQIIKQTENILVVVIIIIAIVIVFLLYRSIRFFLFRRNRQEVEPLIEQENQVELQ